MQIFGKMDAKQTRFKDLAVGDVFCFIKDIANPGKVKVYMRGGFTSTDKTAVNLESGIMYTFNPDEPVKVLNAQLTIKSLDE